MFQKIANHLIRGQKGEKLAKNHLKKQGIEIITQNYRCKSGEIDIIAREQNTLLFIEVRLRKKNALVSPAQSITPKKQQKWKKTALHYLQTHYPNPPNCRFDAILIEEDGENTEIEWIKGIML